MSGHPGSARRLRMNMKRAALSGAPLSLYRAAFPQMIENASFSCPKRRS